MSKKKDAAARIAERAFMVDYNGIATVSRKGLATLIRRAIAAAVRKERERCVGWVRVLHDDGVKNKVPLDVVCRNIVDGINGNAIRKGKA